MSEAFRPHCVILCERTVPQPIFVAATNYSARELEAQNYLKGKQAHVPVSDCVGETAREDATFPRAMLISVDNQRNARRVQHGDCLHL